MFYKRTTKEKRAKSSHACTWEVINYTANWRDVLERSVLWRSVQRSQGFTAFMERVRLQNRLWRHLQLKRVPMLWRLRSRRHGSRLKEDKLDVDCLRICPVHGTNTWGFSSARHVSFPCWNELHELASGQMNSQETSYCAEEWMLLFAVGYEIHHKDSVQRK